MICYFFATVSNFLLVIIWKLSFPSNLFVLVCENLTCWWYLKWKIANWKLLQDQIRGFNTEIFLQSKRLELGIILRRKRITEALRKKKVRFKPASKKKCCWTCVIKFLDCGPANLNSIILLKSHNLHKCPCKIGQFNSWVAHCCIALDRFCCHLDQMSKSHE